MTDETNTGDAGAEKRAETDAEEQTETGSGGSRSRRERMGDGIRQGIGVLSAFKEALEETIQEARDRGDLSTERAKEVMKEALDRAQAAAEDAKDKLDFAHHADLESARSELDALRASFEALQVRVGALEESVFGGGTEEAGEEAEGDG